MYPVPGGVRAAVLVLSALVLFSAVGAASLALLGPALSSGAKVSWVLAGFEAVVLVASVIGVLFGRGRFGEAPGLALACIAGTVLVASVLGWHAAGHSLLGVSLTPLLGGRLLAAGAIGALGAHSVLSREPTAIRRALVGTALALPGLLVVAASFTGPGRRILDAALGHNPVQQVLVTTMGALALGCLLAAGGHQLIRAFEMGRRTEATSSRAA